MIKSLLVKGFQSHTESELTFVPGVNVICGLSQSGKTALLRALNWVVTNRPTGDGFIHDGSKEASAAVVMERNGQEFGVIRYRSDKDSYYLIPGMKKEDDLIFRAFGADVPGKVKDLFNLSDINIQDQLSPYFLVLDSPGQVALCIREASNLDKIDKIVSSVSSKLRSTDDKLIVTGVEIDVIEAKLKELVRIDLDTFENNLNQVKNLFAKADKLNKDSSALRGQLIDLQDVKERLDQLKLVDIDHLIDLLQECRQKERILFDTKLKINQLSDLLKDLEQVRSRMIVLPSSVEDNLKLGLELVDKRKVIKASKAHLLSLLEDLGDARDDIQLGEVSLKSLEKDRNELLRQLKVCPYCGEMLNSTSRACLLRVEK